MANFFATMACHLVNDLESSAAKGDIHSLNDYLGVAHILFSPGLEETDYGVTKTIHPGLLISVLRQNGAEPKLLASIESDGAKLCGFGFSGNKAEFDMDSFAYTNLHNSGAGALTADQLTKGDYHITEMLDDIKAALKPYPFEQ